MAQPRIVPVEEWQQAREDLLKAEKEVTRAQDALAARRRRLPMTPMADHYVFATPEGPRTLPELFEGRDQLAVYQFMDNGPGHFCPGCTAFTANVPASALELLGDAGITWRTVSNMPLEQLEGYWRQQGWAVPFASSRGTSFADDTGAGGGFMLTLFLRDGGTVYRTYNTTQRGVDRLLFTNSVRDLAVFGRQEDWEDSPGGWPQHPTYG